MSVTGENRVAQMSTAGWPTTRDMSSVARFTALLVVIAACARPDGTAVTKAPPVADSAHVSVMPRNCPDLSGNYVIQGDDGQVEFAIAQRRCDSVGVVWKNVGQVSRPRGPIAWYLLDGMMHQVGSRMAAASLTSDGITIVGEPETAADSIPGRTTFRYKLLPDGDLCAVDRSGRMRGSRYTGSERERNTAASRSESGC